MLRIEHINLVVEDLDRALLFYRAAMPHWRVRGKGSDTWHGKPRNWLHFGDDYQYITLNDNGEGNPRDLTGHSSGLAHFGIVTDNLDALIVRVTEAGFPIHKPGSDEPHRNNVYFLDPDGVEVEFSQYTSDLPELRNYYPD
ncbi:VOC family protein [Paraferrimonas sedimenticola]|uniref:Glyoxalase n=1 Tax=Paraferrimonas sedimenticola TaxID=375674 RepID=A0AA37W2N1_9GAMM|nr:VOC family protein [Paraferrimonas sedimenticola]GLP98052.1 glyoxalase [Paraferrimonas sedimenticola]